MAVAAGVRAAQVPQRDTAFQWRQQFTRRWPRDLRRVRLAELTQADSDGFHRSWIMLFPEGDFVHEQYGELHFTPQRLRGIKANFDRRVRHIDIAIDANHDQDKATGWLECLELRPQTLDTRTGEATPSGLWGRVRWTPLGAQLLRDQIYRYFSPEFGPWTDPETGEEFTDVLIGGGQEELLAAQQLPHPGRRQRQEHLEAAHLRRHRTKGRGGTVYEARRPQHQRGPGGARGDRRGAHRQPHACAGQPQREVGAPLGALWRLGEGLRRRRK